MAHLEILRAGPSTTVQDLGRPGLAELGVPRSGAADRASLRLANRLVGNPEGNAGLEITLGGFRARFTGPAWVAVTGAVGPVAVGARAHGPNSAFVVRAGEWLDVGVPTGGLRTYLAVRGGIAVAPVLGSRATDLLSGLGPAPVEAGAVLPIGDAADPCPGADLAPRPAHPARPVLRVLPGPRDDWFIADALAALCSRDGYQVTAHSNRVGIRLHGPPLRRRRDGELAPEAMVCGALQVPPAGQPILFLADHPVTGGYPVIAVVHDDDIAQAAQARPGQRIRFTGRVGRASRGSDRSPRR